MFILKSSSKFAVPLAGSDDTDLLKNVGTVGILKLPNAKAILTRLVNSNLLTEGNYPVNVILVTHLDKEGKITGSPFEADLAKYKAVNKSNGFNWDQALSCFMRGESYTTINMPYGDIRLNLIKG